MAITVNTSALSRSTNQSSRLVKLGSQLEDLQRQVTTKKKYDTYTGFNTDAYSLQTIKIKTTKMEAYLDNIDNATSNIEQIEEFLSNIVKITGDVVGAINLGELDESGLTNLSDLAKETLSLIQDTLNEKGLDGNYLFSGCNISEAPVVSAESLNSNYQSQITGWLNGTITTAQLETNSEAFTSTSLGLSSSLSTATGRIIQIKDNISVDSSVKADSEGIQNIIKGLSILANLKYPSVTDSVDETDLKELLTYTAETLSTGSEQTTNEIEKLASKISLIESIQETLKNQVETYTTQIDDLENADTSEALIKMQLLETQLETSYKITSLVSQLSLINYM